MPTAEEQAEKLKVLMAPSHKAPQALAHHAPPAEVLTAATLGGLKVEPVAEVTRYINIIVYGDSGVGKTVLAGSASAIAEMSPVIVVDIEGGTMSLNATYPDVTRVRIKTWADMQKVYDELYRGKHGYKTVVLDSLTEINNFSRQQIMKDLMAAEPGRDPDIPSQREWGKNIEQTRKLVRAFRDLPMNVIFTALSVKDKAPSGLTLTRPSLPGKLSGEVAAFVDIVAYYYIKAKDGAQKRFLLTTGTEKEVAKDRSGRLPSVVEEPTMAKLYDLMFTQPTKEHK